MLKNMLENIEHMLNNMLENDETIMRKLKIEY